VRPARKADSHTAILTECVGNVGASTSHNPMGLQGLLQGQLCILPCILISLIYFKRLDVVTKGVQLTHCRICRLVPVTIAVNL
jgi:hypothetical protein